MGCHYPMAGFMRQDSSGARRFTMSSPRVGCDYTPQTVPCGQCVGCRIERSRQWAIRCMHEASLYSSNSFITLTYADEYLPLNLSLDYKHFQDFMKRLRFAAIGIDTIVEADGREQRPIRFYMAGEYGSENGRPHFHACIFNYDFPDKYPFKLSPSGEMLFRSPQLEELWPFGFSSIGTVNFSSAAYVARYVMKKRTGKDAASHYAGRIPEFCKMSLKPGIGARWFSKYSKDVFPHDHVIVNGKPTKPPRYYDNLYERVDPFGWEEVSFERFLASQQRNFKLRSEYDSTGFCARDKTVAQYVADRLKVKETIVNRRLAMLKRTI